jgi:hypothetical protein
MSQVNADKIAPSTGTTLTLGDVGDTITTAGTVSGFGKILQVLQTVVTATDSTTAVTGSFVDMAGMTVAITPSAVTSKVLVLWTANISSGNSVRMNIRLMRDSATPFLGAVTGSRIRTSTSDVGGNQDGLTPSSAQFLDSPSTTSATTYKLQWCLSTASTLYLNRSYGDSDTTAYNSTASTITVMEIGA